ncbi:hypothetical protein IFM89_035820 [Coptis chinensis]|uniref:Uncharacterized protein n=1 Tax=Coptis chinensis TaxID=261450 RepID=A0A835I572_9MAGN|nr:hypothetical protein IFM89_035820 [Coptis chinensis]
MGTSFCEGEVNWGSPLEGGCYDTAEILRSINQRAQEEIEGIKQKAMTATVDDLGSSSSYEFEDRGVRFSFSSQLVEPTMSRFDRFLASPWVEYFGNSTELALGFHSSDHCMIVLQKRVTVGGPKPLKFESLCNLFEEEFPVKPILDGIEFNSVGAEDAAWLERDFEEDEVKVALKSLVAEKSFRPDWFPMLVFQK